MYFFISKRARLRVSGGFFDSHKAGKNLRLVNLLWALQLMQFILVLISPSVFAVALHSGLVNGAKFSSNLDWAVQTVYEVPGIFNVTPAILVIVGYLLVYILWTVNAYHAKVLLLSCI
jgi:hypothetical protein